ncbi:hypothetical protein K469DRAFT_717868 [Zopfia rhizophila CBS 207.26]|uniref:Uncharacterized protein n=1 Tax=Zopfia rhizophila CBS 207.26 TaxID=1314779 RepID=A0A6A6DHE1_9PEZI|nr:hypothetical protein K469DRAFT_717868 [Zopfia rhizophila CBS 207.26]
MGPVHPPTPTRADPTTTRPALPRASTDREFWQKTTQSPTARVSGGFSSRSLANSNEVRRLPRPATLHNIPRARGMPPPVPLIPDRFKALAQPFQPQEKHSVVSSNTPLRLRLITFAPDPPIRSRSRMCSTNAAISSAVMAPSPLDEDYASPRSAEEARPLLRFQLSASLPRPWLFISIDSSEDSEANEISKIQVKDYMPPLWWAGRFQSRLDHWRTEAIKAEIKSEYQPTGTLAHCKLKDEKQAACHIFLELRNLCGSNKAADSLWVFSHPLSFSSASY